MSDICYLSFPDSNASHVGSTSYTFRIPHQKTHLYGYVYFKCEKDETRDRGYLQKSIVILSKHHFIKLFLDVVNVIGIEYFDKKRNISFEQIYNEIQMNWNLPKLDTQYKFEFLGKTISYTSPIKYLINKRIHHEGNFIREINDENIEYNLHIIQSKRKTFPFREINIYSVFKNHLDYLLKCYELALLGEPIIIIASSPKQCSECVLGVVSVLSSIPYGGDFR